MKNDEPPAIFWIGAVIVGLIVALFATGSLNFKPLDYFDQKIVTSPSGEETRAPYEHKFIQLEGSTVGMWEYVDSSGNVKKTRQCPSSPWGVRSCIETEDGLVTFQYSASRSNNVGRPVVIVGGQERNMKCERLGTFFSQHNHCVV